jgi:hypothetical protein
LWLSCWPVNKTFFHYGGTIKNQQHLLIMASYYHHATQQVPRPTLVLDKQGVTDPRDNASLCIDPQGHLWVFDSGRASIRPGFKFRSRQPYSIEQFDLVQQLEMTYPQPWHVAGKGFLVLFTKYTNGNPVMLYITSNGAQPGPQNDPRIWTVTRWNGTTWITSTVCQSDHNYHMGSLYIRPDRWLIIGPTHNGPQVWQTGGEMALWVSYDQSQTWSIQRQITRNSTYTHSYVRRPRNATHPFFAFWADGNPTSSSPARLYFSNSDGTQVR